MRILDLRLTGEKMTEQMYVCQCSLTVVIDILIQYRCNRFAIVEWLQTLLIVVPAETVLLLRYLNLPLFHLFVTDSGEVCTP